MAERKKYELAFMATVAVEALREKESIKALAEKYNVSPYLVSKWKRLLIVNADLALDKGREIERRIKKIEKIMAKIEKLMPQTDE